MKYEITNRKTKEKTVFESDAEVAGTRLKFLLIAKNWNIKDCDIKEVR